MIRLSALGDTVHALALANGLKHGYPAAHLTWILQELPYQIVKYQPSVDRFIVFNRRNGWTAWRQLHAELKNQRFDLLIVPQVSIKAGLIAAMVSADIKLGFDFRRSREFHWLVTNRKLPHRPAQHVQDQFLEFLEYLGIHDYVPRWDFVFTPEEIDWRNDFFRRSSRAVAACVIASSDPRKDWNAAGYAQVMDHMDQKMDLQPMMVGGPSRREAEIADQIMKQCRCRPIVALEKPIRHTLLQLSGSRLVVSPDTGPLHAAVAMNIPSIGLYGFSNPRRCGPYRRFPDLLIDAYTDPGEEQAPIRRKTKTNRMDLITPDHVIEKMELAVERYRFFQ